MVVGSNPTCGASKEKSNFPPRRILWKNCQRIKEPDKNIGSNHILVKKFFMNLKHIVSTKQFLNKKILNDIFKVADSFEKTNQRGRVPKILQNKILSCVFYEPSTRTRFSFESAMLKLGGQVISTESAGHFSSAIKGETLEDSIRIISGYSDIIVLRHPEVGAAERAAKVSLVPIVNAGDGSGEHPTQALLDLYTIRKELGRLDDLKIAMVGDLLYGRTIHSLIYLLSISHNIEVFLVSPRELKLPEKYKSFLEKHKIKFSESDNLENIISKIDVLYMTRIQKERFSSSQLYERVKNSFALDKKLLNKLRKQAVIMHPLPRVNEISQEVDSDNRAAYFRQARNGLYIRMALLNLLFRK
ncbi:MAG: aspartate carbamoyltransferase [Patescibacteria group bacterium]